MRGLGEPHGNPGPHTGRKADKETRRQQLIDATIVSVLGKELDITKENERVVISFAYEKEIELVGPVFLLIKYAGRSK